MKLLEAIQDQSTWEIIVEPQHGAFRAMIKSVDGRPLSAKDNIPFIASGKSAADALYQLAGKLKDH